MPKRIDGEVVRVKCKLEAAITEVEQSVIGSFTG